MVTILLLLMIREYEEEVEICNQHIDGSIIIIIIIIIITNL